MEPFSKVLPHCVSGSSLEGRKSSEVGLLATCHGGGLHKCRWRLGVPRHSSPQLPGHSATQGVGRRQSLQQPLQGQPQEVQLLGGLLELGLSLQRGHQPMGREGVGTVAQATWRHPQRGLDQKCLVLPHCHPTRPVHSASCHCGGWWRNEETRVQRGAAGGTGGGGPRPAPCGPAFAGSPAASPRSSHPRPQQPRCALGASAPPPAAQDLDDGVSSQAHALLCPACPRASRPYLARGTHWPPGC